MTSNALDRITSPSVPTPEHVGQATAVEQSRAFAEVQAAVVVAQQRPRDITRAVAELRQSCGITAMAERAFYRYARGGTNVTGPSVHLMRELARCFGNVQYGIAELRRDDDNGLSEMQAYAWDVQTNTRSAQIFVVPHKRDKRSGAEKLVDMRDIYENNANQGARRLREQIRSVLPPWFVEEAVEACNRTLKDGGGKPLPQRIADAIRAFETVGVDVDRLERKLGRAKDRWNEHDIAQLTVTYKSLQRGEITVEDEFPDPRITAEEVLGKGRKPKAAKETASDETGGASPDDPTLPDPADGGDPRAEGRRSE